MASYPKVAVPGVRLRSALAWVFSALLSVVVITFWLRPTILSLVYHNIFQLTLMLFILSWFRLLFMALIFLVFVWFTFTLIPVLHKFGFGKNSRVEFKGDPLYFEKKGNNVLQVHFVVGSALFDSISELKKFRFIRKTFPSRLDALKEGNVIYAETIESETLMLSLGFTRVSSRVSPIVGVLCLVQTLFSFIIDPACPTPFKKFGSKLSKGNRWPKRYVLYV